MEFNLSRKLTKRQHFVPITYLRGWSARRWNEVEDSSFKTVRAHFKDSNKSEPRNPKSILEEDWFYERDSHAPDNEIENTLGGYETSWSPTMLSLDTTLDFALKIYNDEPSIKNTGISLNQYLMRSLVTRFEALPKYADIIKVFAAISYFRTLAALAIKTSELKRDPRVNVSPSAIEMNAWWLAKDAFASTVVDRFKCLNLKLLIAQEESFVTCDRPCFDVNIADKKFDPLFGYDIGRLNTVVACFPLSSRLVALLMPEEIMIHGKIVQTPKYDALCLTALGVKTLNVGIFQSAEKVVVSTSQYQELTDIDPSWNKQTT